jgi:hypothetical protein
MLRLDERTAWSGFLAAAPRFAGEDLAGSGDGPDPPDVICTTTTGRVIGVELTKWVEHDQVTNGRGREFFESSYLRIIESENEPRPDRIGCVLLNPKSERVRPDDKTQLRSELFALLAKEDATPEPSGDEWHGPPTAVPPWNTPQGARVDDFAGFPMLEKYMNDVWIFPRRRLQNLAAGQQWIMFEAQGGAYTPDWMVQAAIDRIRAKIKKYKSDNIRAKHALAVFDLLCYYCDEALLHNTPIDIIGFGFPELASRVAEALAAEPRVFDRIFLFYPYHSQQVFDVSSAVAVAA